ncbi:MAG: hypothetical protein WCT26_04045 [Candidatus Buchananbacteria bacterium]
MLDYRAAGLAANTVINVDTVWNAGEVKIFSGGDNLSIEFGAALTINGGAVLKMGKNSSILVDGKLHLVGQADNPVVITSLKDDDFGGDTNSDGAATVPAKGDWGGIILNTFSTSSLPELIADYSAIKFAGGFQDNISNYFQIVKAGTVRISHSDILDNDGEFYILDAQSISISDSNIYNPTQPLWYGYFMPITMIYSDMAGIVDAKNNYWGNIDGPTTLLDAYTGRIKGTVLYHGNFEYLPFAASPFPFLTMPVIAKINPVILIPGVLGSWPDKEGKKLILDPVLHTYDDLWYALIAAGFKSGETLFDFPYEWRKSNVITAQLLKAKIVATKAACVPSETIDCSKVDLIAHSMGGIVARQYIASADYGNDVDQLIFIATPHKGSPKTYLMWEGGYLGSELNNQLLKMILIHESKKVTRISGDIGLVTYIQDYNIDPVKELLPIYPYIYDEVAGQVRYYPNGYPVNQFLENLNSAENLARLKSDVRVTNIIGNTGGDTITGYNIVDSTEPLPLWADGMPKNFYGDKSGILTGNGDGTVPAISNNDFLDLEPIVINQDHGKAVSYAQVEIIKELTGTKPATEIHNDYSIFSLLMISLRCPADIEIIAPDGKRLGFDALSSSTLWEIPDGYYYRSTDESLPEYAIIPNPQPGNYQVRLIGTDSGGDYTVGASYFDSSTSTETEYSGVILSGQNQALDFDFTASTSSPVMAINSAITIDSAISDVSLVYDRGLLSDKNAKKKIIQQYDLLKLKVKVIDKLITLAESGLEKLQNNTAIKSPVKDKLAALAWKELDKLKQRRTNEIADNLADLDEYLQKLQTKAVLKPLGYGIIKANNDYLTNNW